MSGVEEPQNGVYMDFAPIMLTTILQGQTEDAGLYCELKINNGERPSFRVDGSGIQGSTAPLRIQNIQGVNRYVLEYSPYILTNDNAVLSFTVDIYDKYGFVLSKDFTYRYASKIVRVYTKWFNGGQDLGVIRSPDAVKCIRKTTISAVYYLFYWRRRMYDRGGTPRRILRLQPLLQSRPDRIPDLGENLQIFSRIFL